MQGFKPTTKEEAIQILILSGCRPPQIDYVSPGDKQKEYEAEKFLGALPLAEYEEAHKIVRDAIDEYYSEDGAAQFDAMF